MVICVIRVQFLPRGPGWGVIGRVLRGIAAGGSTAGLSRRGRGSIVAACGS